MASQTAMQSPPWCDWCEKAGHRGAAFCFSCGWNYKDIAAYAQPSKPPPWQQGTESWSRAPSPRGRRHSRTRQKPIAGQDGKKGGKGKDKSKDKGKGKGADGGKSKQSVPQLQMLPQPPALAQPSLPNASAASAATASETTTNDAQAKLDQLLTTLTSSKEVLPPSVMQILGEYSSSSTNAESKALLRAVKAKTAAKRELAKLRASKGTFMSAWSAYLAQVSELLEKQLAEQQAALQQYDEAEIKWEEQLKEASQSLARLSTGKEDGPDDAMEADDHSVTAETAEMDSKIAASVEAVKRTANAQAASLLQALRQAQTAAEVKEERRGASRTPRRNAGNAPVDIPSSPELAEAPPGKAP